MSVELLKETLSGGGRQEVSHWASVTSRGDLSPEVSRSYNRRFDVHCTDWRHIKLNIFTKKKMCCKF